MATLFLNARISQTHIFRKSLNDTGPYFDSLLTHLSEKPQEIFFLYPPSTDIIVIIHLLLIPYNPLIHPNDRDFHIFLRQL